jgi:hypothetical protein
MPSVAAIRRLPWARLYVSATWLWHQGRGRLEKNLSDRERNELKDLMKRSKGRRSNLSSRDQARFRDLVKRGIVGG